MSLLLVAKKTPPQVAVLFFGDPYGIIFHFVPDLLRSRTPGVLIPTRRNKKNTATSGGAVFWRPVRDSNPRNRFIDFHRFSAMFTY
jgi:hypothetical protein